MNGEYLELISLNIWHIIATIANLLILAWIIKKLLFKPVKDIIAKRQGEVEQIYRTAEEASAQLAALPMELMFGLLKDSETEPG